MKAFYVDLSVCNGCYCCQIACKDEHVANDWSPYAKPQPDTGQFWIGLTELGARPGAQGQGDLYPQALPPL
jgi:tetrathionate reductase subunit B